MQKNNCIDNAITLLHFEPIIWHLIIKSFNTSYVVPLYILHCMFRYSSVQLTSDIEVKIKKSCELWKIFQMAHTTRLLMMTGKFLKNGCNSLPMRFSRWNLLTYSIQDEWPFDLRKLLLFEMLSSIKIRLNLLLWNLDYSW